MVTWRDRMLPRRFDDKINDKRLPYDVEIEVEVIDGKPTCRKLVIAQRVDGPLITSTELRNVRLSMDLAAAAARRAFQVSRHPEGSISIEPMMNETVGVKGVGVESPRGRTSKSPEVLLEALPIFLNAGGGADGYRAVESQLDVSYSTAMLWVKTAQGSEDDPSETALAVTVRPHSSRDTRTVSTSSAAECSVRYAATRCRATSTTPPTTTAASSRQTEDRAGVEPPEVGLRR